MVNLNLDPLKAKTMETVQLQKAKNVGPDNINR